MPDVKTASSLALEDFETKYATGEAFPSSSNYGRKMERIPEEFQTAWKNLAERLMLKDLFARIEEVKRAADGGFYWRNIFDALWSDTQFTWLTAGSPGAGDDHDTLKYPLNIYQKQGRSFMKIVGHKPEVHFVASGDITAAAQIADGANHLLEEIENLNDAETMSQDFARIAWTDGRYGIYTRWVADGARFGYYDEEDEDYEDAAEGIGGGSENPPEKKPRKPKGGEVMSILGVPWLKVPINMKSQHEFGWLMYSDEIELAAAKSLYPDIANKIQAGTPGPAEYMFDRTTRIALTQGLHLVSQMAEAVDQLPTIQMIWVRPCEFAEIENEKTRNWFQDNYPDGGKVVFIGNQYAESCNESMDDHWSIGHAVRGHGQSTPAYGFSMLTAQDAFSDCFDLEMETHMRGIQAWYGDPNVFDFPAMSKEKARPGGRYPLKKDLSDDINVQQKTFLEPTPQVNAQLIDLRNALLNDIPASITGISSAAVGQADENNTTLGGISILRAAARGEAGTAFTGYVSAYRRSCEQAVRIGAKYRMAEADERGILTIKKKGQSDAQVDLVELRSGNIWCVTDQDQTYPSTAEEKQMALTALVMAAQTGDPQAKLLLSDPANAETFTKLRGLPNLTSTTGNIGMKVNQTIELLLQDVPKPNPQLMQKAVQLASQMQAQGEEVPPLDPYKVMKPTLEPSPMDDVTSELPFFMNWYYSPAGQRNRYDKPQGFLNVELYIALLKQKAQQLAQQQQQQAVAPQLAIEAAKKQKTPTHPTESIAFKDLGPSGKVQLGKQAGLDLSADAAADVTEDAVAPPQPRKLKRA